MAYMHRSIDLLYNVKTKVIYLCIDMVFQGVFLFLCLIVLKMKTSEGSSAQCLTLWLLTVVLVRSENSHRFF